MAASRCASGVFSLDESYKNVGSYIKRSDRPRILRIPDSELLILRFTYVGGIEVIDENVLHKTYYNLPLPECFQNTKMSLDEVILSAIIKKTLPDAEIEYQIPCGRRRIDLKSLISEIQYV